MIESSMMGLFVGDALGAQVEFKSKERIRSYFDEKGGFDMYDGGIFNLVKGQVTDDSEMAMALIRSFNEMGDDYDHKIALKWYKKWINASPFDYGSTTSNALWYEEKNMDSQANGALMRCAPLAWKYRDRDLKYLMEVAEEDCRLTHPNPVCVDANKIYLACMWLYMNGWEIEDIYDFIVSDEFYDIYYVDKTYWKNLLKKTIMVPWNNFVTNQGWVVIGLYNALYHFFAETSFEDAMKKSIYAGGDTDTNACICGALVGLSKEVPAKWVEVVRKCSPKKGEVKNGRPEWLWTSKYKELFELVA